MKRNKFISLTGRIISIFLAAVMLVSLFPSTYAVEYETIGNYDYTITNPYASVDWDSWKPYRAATHVHTVRSDGNIELNDMIEKYYELGYQGLALTDHGTVNYSWTKDQKRLAIFGYQYFVHGNVDEISEARYTQITTGSDRGGNGMINIPLGIELNGSSTAKCHVNSYFADCGHGDLEMGATWPRDAVAKSHKAGGISHINHVGEWTEGKSDINTYNADFVRDFASIFTAYSSCVGMELVNTSDNRTHNDRYLYDETLKLTAPSGRNIFGFCEDDSHEYEDCGNNAQFFMMPQNTAENVRTSMETGAFFACSKFAKTADELGDGFTAQGDFPMVSRIDVDEKRDAISFIPYNAKVIKIVADGVVLDEKQVTSDYQKVTFDLNEYEDRINSYVRFYITGDGGICYAQPFLLTRSEYSIGTVRFNLPSGNAALTVKNSGGEVQTPATVNNRFILEPGSYTYSAVCDGYESASGAVEVSRDDYLYGTQYVIDVKMNRLVLFPALPSTTVDHERKFIYGVEPGTESLDEYVTVLNGGTVTYTHTPNGPGTGTVATVDYPENTTQEYNLVIFGDVTGDGYYDGEDAFTVSLIVGNMLTREQVGDAAWFAADCNHDGVIDAGDVALLNEAGVLLSCVDQNETDLTSSSVYDEYVQLISQQLPEDENTPEDEHPEAQEPSDFIPSFIRTIIDFFLSIIKMFSI